MIEFTIGCLLFVWFAACAVGQLRFVRLPEILRETGILPLWSFFAPVPSISDFTLWFRDERSDGSVVNWVPVKCLARGKYAFIWNPGRRERKAIFDLTVKLMLHMEYDPASIHLSVPYLVLLAHVCSQPRLGSPVKTQFALTSVESQRTSDPLLLFLSTWRDVEA
jgi:hypothetical protein